jgi:RNA polymerase sigma-70 factor (ECF subfamily)
VGSTSQPQIDIGPPSVGEYPRADWDGLWARHSHGLYRRVLGIVRNPEDAEDALQEGLLSAFKNLPRFEGRSGLSTWLTRIVINAALMQLRSQRTHEATSLDEPLDDTAVTAGDRIVDPNPSPEQVLLMAELRGVLVRSMDVLSPEMRKAVSLRYMRGLSSREAARTCGISENTLKARLRRARRRLASSKTLLALL